MLLQFNFKNFKSFRDEAILDMTATGISEYKFHIVEEANDRILPVAAIFGANASGKSNVLDAFQCMARLVVLSYISPQVEKTGKESLIQALRPKPFLFDVEHSNSETTFEVYFIDDNSGWVYNYGFSILKGKIKEEWLNYKTKTAKDVNGFKKIFYRLPEKGILELDGISSKHQENIRIALRDESLIVSLGSILKISKLDRVWNWFASIAFINYGNPRVFADLSETIPDGFADNEAVQQDVVEYLAAFDPSIVGFQVESLESENEDNNRIKINSLHRVNETNGVIPISMREESSGTQKMFSLYPVLQSVLRSGSVLFIDELNARLHPLLVRNFVITFLDSTKNPNHAQLVFTTHDAWQLNNDMFRRDEIWMTEKGNDQATILFSLSDFEDEKGSKIRKDENYEKNYMLGKYGAIPIVKGFNIMGRDE